MARKPLSTPTETVITLFGGIRPLARDLDCSPRAILQWRHRGGRIPAKWQRPLLDLARTKGKRLRAEDLIA